MSAAAESVPEQPERAQEQAPGAAVSGVNVFVGDIVGKHRRLAEPANTAAQISVTACPFCGGRAVFNRCHECGARQMLTIQPEVLAALATVGGVAVGSAVDWLGLGPVATVVCGTVAALVAFGLPKARLVWRREDVFPTNTQSLLFRDPTGIAANDHLPAADPGRRRSSSKR